ELEDIISFMDDRIVNYRFKLHDFFHPLGIPIEEVSYRPRKIARSAICYEAIRPEYFVLLLFLLERIGFQVNPTRFVEILLPSILQRSKKILSSAELEIFWYKINRHKSDDIILFSSQPKLFCDPDRTLTLANGYKLFLY